MARLSQVKTFNYFMQSIRNYAYIMTLGNGSMADEPRSRGWVVWESPKLGDAHDYAKFYKNKRLAELDLKARA